MIAAQASFSVNVSIGDYILIAIYSAAGARNASGMTLIYSNAGGYSGGSVAFLCYQATATTITFSQQVGITTAYKMTF